MIACLNGVFLACFQAYYQPFSWARESKRVVTKTYIISYGVNNDHAGPEGLLGQYIHLGVGVKQLAYFDVHAHGV